MIYFDLDGVIRWLTHDLRNGQMPKTWSETLPNGEDMCEYIHKNLNALITAPPTKYYDIIRRLPKINIITNQFQSWKPYTLTWIYKHFKPSQIEVNFVSTMEEKLSFLNNGNFLVEDYPFFPDYSKIILIDWPYNRNVEKPYLRITTPEQLAEVIL
jgi:hypothetical protein